jgi:methyl-accepting chemotaxis protein
MLLGRLGRAMKKKILREKERVPMRSSVAIGTKLICGVAIIIVLAVIIGGAGLSSIGALKKGFDTAVDGSMRKIALADEMVADSGEMVSAQRGIILATLGKDTAEGATYNQTFRQNSEALQRALNEMAPLIMTEEGKTLIAELAAGVSEWQPHYEELVRVCAAGDVVGANRIRKEITAPIYKKIGSSAHRLALIETEQLAAGKTVLADEQTKSRWTTLGLLGLCLLAGGCLVVVVGKINAGLRQAASQLSEGANKVATAAAQVSSSSQSLAQGSSEQAAALEETSASARKISSLTRQNSARAQKIAQLMNDAIPIVNAVNSAHRELAGTFAKVSTSSEKVSKVIKIIDEIAFQTNILALNAAVEAARAGQAGAGFAAVAHEVRDLAQRCTSAARETAGLIEESLVRSGESRHKLDGVLKAMDANNKISGAVKIETDQIGSASGEQVRDIEQICNAISQIEQVTQTTAANAQESAAAGAQMNAESETMKDVVERLTALVRGGEPAGNDRKSTASTFRGC